MRRLLWQASVGWLRGGLREMLINKKGLGDKHLTP